MVRGPARRARKGLAGDLLTAHGTGGTRLDHGGFENDALDFGESPRLPEDRNAKLDECPQRIRIVDQDAADP